MLRTFNAITIALGLLAAPTAFAQTTPGSSNGSAPQAGVAGPADGAKGGTNNRSTSGGATEPGSTSSGRGTATGGNAGGPAGKN